jgi:hypothetical protein
MVYNFLYLVVGFVQTMLSKHAATGVRAIAQKEFLTVTKMA